MTSPCALLALLLNGLIILNFASAQTTPFALLAADPPSPYEGQPFTLTLALFTTGEEFEPDLRLRGIPDAFNLQPFRPLPPLSQPFEGKTYQTLRFQAEIHAPAPGDYSMNPWIEGTLVRTEQYFFLTRRTRYPIRIPVRPFHLPVRKIPVEQAPPGYDGLLGALTLSGSPSTNRYQPGDLLTVRWQIRGVGRLDRIPPLGIPPIEGFRVYPPRRVETEIGQTWEQVLIPTNDTVTAIPPLVLIAFNPFSDRFETLAAGPFDLLLDRNRPPPDTPDTAALLQELMASERPIVQPVFFRLPSPRFTPANPQQKDEIHSLFASTIQAQQQGRYADAWSTLLRIQSLLDSPPPELYANIGAALEGMGYPSRALLWYLRALRKIPWSKPLRTRLRTLTTKRTLSIPSLNSPFGTLPPRAWKAVAVAGFVAVLLACFLRRQKSHSLSVRLVSLAGLILATAGMQGAAWWRWGPPSKEAVIFADQPIPARLAPNPNALVLFSLTPGTVVVKMETRPDGCRVRVENAIGWVSPSALETP